MEIESGTSKLQALLNASPEEIEDDEVLVPQEGQEEDDSSLSPMERQDTSTFHQNGNEENSTLQQKEEEEEEEHQNRDGFCIECQETLAVAKCLECTDVYCEMCFQALHRRGKRIKHTRIPIGSSAATPQKRKAEDEMDEEEDEDFGAPLLPGQFQSQVSAGDNFLERAKYIPLRLTYKERKYLRLIESSLGVCNYTNKVDALSLTQRKRMYFQIQDICALLTGLIASLSSSHGKDIVKTKNFKELEKPLRKIFELGRRHKIMNPEKMRGEYGKLMYLLMDANTKEVQELLGFSCTKEILTVYKYLEERDGLALLQDSNVEVATRAISGEGKSRIQVRQEVDAKERAVKFISRKYTNSNLSSENIKHCLYSIGDNRSYLLSSRDPVDKVIEYLKQYFSPDHEEEGFSLAIYGGVDGACITHSHERQFHYALQSLTLWRNVTHDMFRLWYLSDEDLLDTKNSYELKDTGQGINRMQQSPRVASAMRTLLHRTQQSVGHWVGSSVIHLGDTNVPNALVFIDKYTQVERILNPICITLRQAEQMYTDSQDIRVFIDTFGGLDRLKKIILHDFFHSAFDGSGSEGGSCVDGRLTSCWNWCSKLHTKPFYPIFKLTGFTGFDGNFQN